MKTMSLLFAGLALTGSLFAADSTIGLTVKDGVLLKDGRPFRAFGINVVSVADEILEKGEGAADCFAAIEFIGRKRIPFIRFWASYFQNIKPYLTDPEKYWRNMDLLVNACEEANVGLAPTLHWTLLGVPGQLDEYKYQLLDHESKSYEYVMRYTREFVARYRDRPHVWFWELTNECNLMWDLPNVLDFLKGKNRDRRNVVHFYTTELLARDFGRLLRGLDPTRPISSGNAGPRPSQYRMATMFSEESDVWLPDTYEQNLQAARWTAPDPLDIFSVHKYYNYSSYDPQAVREDLAKYMRMSEAMKKPLYLGEFGILDKDYGRLSGVPDFDDARYKTQMRDLFEAVYDAKVPLAAYWVCAVKDWALGSMGVVNVKDTRFNFVVDMIAEYNDRIQEQLKED